MLRPSYAWIKMPEFDGYTILDPDGWDRTNFDESWTEPITLEEFRRRVSMSTVQINRDW